MRYELKRRRERREEYDDVADPDHLAPISKSRMRTLYEWDGPSGRYRSPHAYVLDRRRWAVEERDEEDDDPERVPQPSLTERDQDIQEEP